MGVFWSALSAARSLGLTNASALMNGNRVRPELVFSLTDRLLSAASPRCTGMFGFCRPLCLRRDGGYPSSAPGDSATFDVEAAFKRGITGRFREYTFYRKIKRKIK
jgi:hypothetical protein